MSTISSFEPAACPEPGGRRMKLKLFSDYVSQLLSRRTLERLGARFGKCHIALLDIRIDDFYTLVGSCGAQVGLELLEVLAAEAGRAFSGHFPQCRIISIDRTRMVETLIFFELPEAVLDRMNAAILFFRMELLERFHRAAGVMIDTRPDLRVGFARIPLHQREQFVLNIFNLYCDAARSAERKFDPQGPARDHEAFLRILDQSRLRVRYQPVIHLQTGKIAGWACAFDIPEGPHFYDVTMLSEYAAESDGLETLAASLFTAALGQMGRLETKQRLFIPIPPGTFGNCGRASRIQDIAGNYSISPENLVVQILETENPFGLGLIIEQIEALKSKGLAVALSGVGDGSASLRTISQIKPDFIKIAPSLVRGIDFNPIKRAMVESFVTLARKLGLYITAEGIETATELSAIISMGVDYGQGNGIAPAENPKPEICAGLPAQVCFQEPRSSGVKCNTPLRQLVKNVPAVGRETLVQEVRQMLADQPPMSSVAVVDEDQRAVGLLMNYNLDRKLGSRFGISLYFKREISRLMDPSPLVADINEPVEEVAKLAMNREDFKIYDDIVVTEHGRFAGTVSIQKMLDFLAEVQVKIAMGANPLSGLPGNVAIEQEISRRATGRIASSLIYIDLDNFKVFNDAYGFENGDQLILFTAKLLRNAIRNSGKEDDFIGHVGGDDFVIISSQKRAMALSETITRMFEAGVVRFYNPEDREEGYIMGKGRDGVKRKFPIVSVSIGIVDCDFQTEFSMNDLSHRVAEIKKYAKSIPGNSYVKDRRQPLGSCENQPDFGKGFYHEK